MGKILRNSIVFGLSTASLVGLTPTFAQQTDHKQIPALPTEQMYILDDGCIILGVVEEKDVTIAPKRLPYPAKWKGECRGGLAHGSGELISGSGSKAYTHDLSHYHGRQEARILPGNINADSERFGIWLENLDPVSRRVPDQFPPNPDYASVLATADAVSVSRESQIGESVLHPIIRILDKQTKETHQLNVSYYSGGSTLSVTNEVNGKNSGKNQKCSSYDVATACAREWNAQIDAFWKKAQPLYDRALADAVATRDAQRRKIDLLNETIRLASGEGYPGAPFTPEERAWAEQMHAKRGVMLAAAGVQEQKSAAVAAQDAAADKQRRASLEAEAGLRRSAYAATPKAKAAGVALAAKSFMAPSDTSNVAVIINRSGEADLFRLDTELLELPTGTEPIDITEGDQIVLNGAVTKLKTQGVKTLYVIDLTRWEVFFAPISITTSRSEVTVATDVQDNPEYAALAAELKKAREELAEAKAEYDDTDAQANSGGFGTSAEGILTGLISVVSDGSRYSDADKEVSRLEKALARIDPKLSLVEKASVVLADSKYHSIFSGRVAIAACDLTIGRCAERERVIESEITVDQPLVLLEGDPEYERRTAQDNSATEALDKQTESYSQIGFSTSAMGKYVEGLPMFVPIGNLAAWLSFASEDFQQRFKGRYAHTIAAGAAVEKELIPVATSLAGIAFEDPTGAIGRAADSVALEERRKNVQGLE